MRSIFKGKIVKKILLFTSILGMCFGLFQFAIWHLTDGFSINKIQSHLAYHSEWDVINPPKQLIKSLLNQDFYYIGLGSQHYIFESEDRQVVIKFFRHAHYRLPAITQIISSPNFLKIIQDQKKILKQKKLDSLFQNYIISYNELKEEAGLVYLHLNKTSSLNTTLTLYDKIKRAHIINIDDYEFILQQHGEHLIPHLNHLLKKGKRSEAKGSLFNLISLLATSYHKGICDDNPCIQKNVAFKRNKAFFIDTGKFVKKEHLNLPLELSHSTQFLRGWLLKNDPELVPYIDKYIEAHRTRH